MYVNKYEYIVLEACLCIHTITIIYTLWACCSINDGYKHINTYTAMYLAIYYAMAVTNFNSFIAIFKGSVSPSNSTITGAFML